MKIFFSASIHGKKQNLDKYKKIIDLVEKSGHEIEHEYILQNTPEEMNEWQDKKNLDFHQWVIDEIRKSDVLFAELSYPSTSVGYLVSHAVNNNKPVVIFYSGDQEIHLLKTLDKILDNLSLVRYKNLIDLEREVPIVLDFLKTSQDVRFNFFVTPEISNYLDWIAKHKRIPRSVYLRRLIDLDKKENNEFQA